MTRSVAREIAMRVIFAISEGGLTAEWALDNIFSDEYYATLAEEDSAYAGGPPGNQLQYIRQVVEGVYGRTDELEGYIGRYAVGWRLERVSRVAVAIIKTAMFEVLYMPDIPDAAAINDAVELGKRYETPETAAFINGVLGSFSRAEPAAEPER
ncbi:MAG: transcription antitermination factor NusB [Oscillospiraceae bacterium]|jgi:N utilization substance protein B|nr:transcription antitermination factor NusB [Oscillospiraceae bacterium]